MPTGTKKGLVAARKVGSAPDNKGLTTYAIASGYGTGLGKNDPVKLAADGTIILATNDAADSIGVFMGVSFTDSLGAITNSKNWPASTVATNIEALVMDDPFSTFNAKGEGPIPLVQKGDIFAMNLPAPDTFTGQSNATVKCLAEIIGDVDVSAVVDFAAVGFPGIAANDSMTVQTSAPGALPTTVVFVALDGITELLIKLNAIPNIVASTQAGTGFLVIKSTDGYDLVTAELVGTPFATLFAGAAGTFSEVVGPTAGMVKVISVIDAVTNDMEVVLVDHDLRDDG